MRGASNAGTNFYLLGQSRGGILAIEYALKHQDRLKALVISNMMASIPQHNEYAEKVLMPTMDRKVLAEIKRLEATGKTEDPRYMETIAGISGLSVGGAAPGLNMMSLLKPRSPFSDRTPHGKQRPRRRLPSSGDRRVHQLWPESA